MTRKMIGLLATFVLVLSACAAVDDTTQAQGESAFALAPTSVASSTASAQDTGDGATTEGIKVHGRWTIEVREPDGTVVERREFENALINPPLMANLLTGFWSTCSTGSTLYAIEMLRGDPATPSSQTMVSGGPMDIGLLNQVIGLFRLEGSFLFSVGDSFDYVRTSVLVDDNGLCQLERFTGTVIPLVTVGDNQTVYVEVEISFS